MAGNIGPTLLDTLQQQLDAVPYAQPEPAAAVVGADGDLVQEAVVESAGAATELGAELSAEQDAGPHAQASTPPIPEPRAETPDDGPQLPQVWVLELSSFQLEGGGHGVQGFEPAAATVLNVTQDHLDWHGGMAAYTAAKARIFGQQAVMVINRDDPVVQAMVPAPVAAKVKGAKAAPKPVERSVLAFGLGAPQQPGDFGVVEEGGMAWLVRALPADETIKRKKGDAAEDLHLQRLMPADALRVRGRHNAANALAALALATAIHCPLAPMLHGLRDYKGEPHRVQFVLLAEGIEVYDDSKGTNVGATVAALAGLGADKAPGKLVVVLGGDGKGQDFSPLVQPLAQHARAVATIGRDAEAIEAVLDAQAPNAGWVVQRFDSLPAATAWCLDQARSGDAVLLSPACASLDMFDNYAHRAQVFVDAAQAWAADRGQA
jgi:UDP-N-acetylmuramoylalanine--D-glutamate ligase